MPNEGGNGRSRMTQPTQTKVWLAHNPLRGGGIVIKTFGTEDGKKCQKTWDGEQFTKPSKSSPKTFNTDAAAKKYIRDHTNWEIIFQPDN